MKINTNYMFEKFNPLSLLNDDVEFLPLVSIEEDDEMEITDYPLTIPILPLRNTVLFPGVVVPVTVGRDKSVKAIKDAANGDKFIGVIAQKEAKENDPEGKDLHQVGTIARIVKVLKMPDDHTTVILHGRDRFAVQGILSEEPFIEATFDILEDSETPDDKEFEALVSSIRDMASKIIKLSPNLPSEIVVMLKNIDSPEFLIHFVSSNLNIDLEEKQKLLEIDDIQTRAEKVLHHLHTELQLLELKNKIQSKVNHNLEKQQRDYFLHQQIKTIQEELGGENPTSEIDNYKLRAKKKKWPEKAQKAFDKEIRKIQRMNPAVGEYSMTLNYLELLLDLPWTDSSKDDFNLKRASRILDKDHYGLDKVKNRILEYLAVLKLKGDMKSPILCFVGPPGVGKTSLGRSIANSLKRKYVRMSLGGVHDESEIRGHRRTYMGSMPGRVIQSIKKSETNNPVFILDEIDKVGQSHRGDPSSALLEVLDPEQNGAFHDNYLEVEYDLSKVMFIATANSLSTIQPALRDRMEIVRISGYSMEEKVEIARKHLVSKQREAHGLKSDQIKISKKILQLIINKHTRESGVRELERKIAAVMRATAKSVAMEEEYGVRITVADIERILGKHNYERGLYEKNNPAGVVIGLAWTSVGGEILFIETSLSKGNGKLTLTGNLGNVMKESVSTALSYLKAHGDTLKIDPERFDKTDYHIHVPEGAIPKDGPSAGVAMLSALASALTGRKIRPYTAMTGEITLRGKVLPVGGIKEKILAAKRAGIKHVMLCKMNQKDVEEINPDFIKGVEFKYVDRMSEVLKWVLV
ncbi:MAG: endopeptidase La [Chitinophagales bacterium]